MNNPLNILKKGIQKIRSHCPDFLQRIFQKPSFWATLAAALICTLTIVITVADRPRAELANPLTTLAENTSDNSGTSVYAGLASASPAPSDAALPSDSYDGAPDISITTPPIVAHTQTSASEHAGGSSSDAFSAPAETNVSDSGTDFITVPRSDLSDLMSSGSNPATPSPSWEPQVIYPTQEPNSPSEPAPDPEQPLPEETPAPVEAPVIYGEFEENAQISGYEYSITVWGNDAFGKLLLDDYLTVSCQSQIVSPEFTDQTKSYFRLPLAEGENVIQIELRDDYGNSSTQTFSIFCTPPAEEKITISVEASTLGLGYLIAPTELTLQPGQPVSVYLSQLLQANGFSDEYDGTLENGYYLKRIHREGAFASVNIPETLLNKIQSIPSLFYNAANSSPDSLGEFDYTQASGWMLCVRSQGSTAYEYLQTGLSALIPSAGDHIRLRFTLANGLDIGGGPSTGGTDENWDQEW